MSRPFWVRNIYPFDIVHLLISPSFQLLDKTYGKYQVQPEQPRAEHPKVGLVLSDQVPAILPFWQRRQQAVPHHVGSLVYVTNPRQRQHQMSSNLRP